METSSQPSGPRSDREGAEGRAVNCQERGILNDAVSI